MMLLYLAAIILGYLILVLAGKTKFQKNVIYTSITYMFVYLQPNMVS
jgi:high-affinity Fe2+/Pb2+ permease